MYFNENTVLFLDGKWLKASETKTSLYNQTLHYGNGVFEGIRAYETEHGPSVFKAREHYERLLFSAKTMYIDMPYSVEEFIQLSYELLEKNNLQNAYIRPLVYLGESLRLNPSEEVHVLLTAWEWDKFLGDKLIDVMVSPYERPNPKAFHVEAKVTGHYANSILASTHAKRQGYDEALLLDMNGNVAEGPGANFFYQKDNKLYTCPSGNILSGITRATIIELCEQLEIPLEEKFFTAAEVKGADGAFFVGTAAEVAGIASLDGVKFKDDWTNTFGYLLSKAYQREVLELEPVYLF